jgi:hypothetical protein
VLETAQNPDRANFPLKSKAKKFDGLRVGFRPSDEKFYAYNSARYDSSKQSSGMILALPRVSQAIPENAVIY